jgi:hypothetical protein
MRYDQRKRTTESKLATDSPFCIDHQFRAWCNVAEVYPWYSPRTRPFADEISMRDGGGQTRQRNQRRWAIGLMIRQFTKSKQEQKIGFQSLRTNGWVSIQKVHLKVKGQLFKRLASGDARMWLRTKQGPFCLRTCVIELLRILYHAVNWSLTGKSL